MKRLKKNILITLFTVVCIALASFTIKGDHWRYETQQTQDLGGPFEASNSRGRFMLVQAIVDSHTFFLSREQAAFSLPDLTIYNGKYLSIFTPGITFLGLPLYILGKIFGLGQFFTFLLNFFVAIGTIFLVSKLSQKLGSSSIAGIISGFLFLFGTNELSYSSTFTQHPISAALVLLGLLNITRKRTLVSNTILGFLFGMALLADVPNLFLFLPLFLYAASSHINLYKTSNRTSLRISLAVLGLVIGAAPFLVGFAWYNHLLTGSYTSIPQLVGRSTTLDPVPEISLTPTQPQSFAPGHFALGSRNLIRGTYTLIFSSERSWFYYSPFLIIGIIGLLIASRHSGYKSLALVCFSAAAINFLVYMLFGDPWGGWAFGPRYLIPSAAIVASGFGIVLDKVSRRIPLLIITLLVSIYSVFINLVGALTTNLVPPKVEAIAMVDYTGYDFRYNFDILWEKQITGSWIYNTFLNQHITPIQLYAINLIWILIVLAILFILLYRSRSHAQKS